jgi:hypothetical protein
MRASSCARRSQRRSRWCSCSVSGKRRPVTNGPHRADLCRLPRAATALAALREPARLGESSHHSRLDPLDRPGADAETAPRSCACRRRQPQARPVWRFPPSPARPGPGKAGADPFLNHRTLEFVRVSDALARLGRLRTLVAGGDRLGGFSVPSSPPPGSSRPGSGKLREPEPGRLPGHPAGPGPQ